MTAKSTKELIQLFSERFSNGDIEGLIQLYEGDAIFPNHYTTAHGSDQISIVLQAYIDSGAKLEFDRQVALKPETWPLFKTNGP